jgi:hypothetical protein
MNIFGKTIRLFLLEGNTNSLVTAELSNWTGIGIRVPKIKIKEYSTRADFQKPGVYILFGKGENNEDAAYIGEAEVIYERLLHHITNKEFWNEVVFFCSKDKYLNKASVKYLENRMHDLANKAGRYVLDQNIPTRSELSEAEQAELDEFLANIKTLTSTLGYRIFEAIAETIADPVKTNILATSETNTTIAESHIFHCKNSKGADATGSPSTQGFVVYKDSLFIKNDLNSLSISIRKEKEQMLLSGLLVPENDLLKLTKDYVFSSPSRAAAMIFANSSNGLVAWQTKSGVSLKQFEF